MNTASTSFRALILSLLLAMLGVLSPRVARAQQGDAALAESLFEAGRALMKKKQYAAACAKFKESQLQDPSPGTLINLGECSKAQGKTATAWAYYKSAAALAVNRGRTQQQQLATQRAAALAPDVSKVTFQKPAKVPAGLTVKLDDRSLGVASLGIPIAVDPGAHTVTLGAKGYKSASKKFSVGAKGGQVSVTLPTLEKAPEQASTSTKTTTPAAGTPPTSGTTPPGGDQGTGHKSSTKMIGYVVGGAGIVLTGVGAVFGILASSQASNAKSDNTLCPNKLCTPAGRSAINSAKGKALVSTIGIGVGVAAIAAGAVLVLTSHSAATPADSASARLVPAVGPHGGGVLMTGNF